MFCQHCIYFVNYKRTIVNIELKVLVVHKLFTDSTKIKSQTMEFPFVINGESVPHIAHGILSFCDIETLKACRLGNMEAS